MSTDSFAVSCAKLVLSTAPTGTRLTTTEKMSSTITAAPTLPSGITITAPESSGPAKTEAIVIKWVCSNCKSDVDIHLIPVHPCVLDPGLTVRFNPNLGPDVPTGSPFYHILNQRYPNGYVHPAAGTLDQLSSLAKLVADSDP
jgi:hypothetical protein